MKNAIRGLHWIGSPKILLVGQAIEPGCIFKKQFLKAKSDSRGNLSWWKLISISVMDINNQIQDTVVGWRVEKNGQPEKLSASMIPR